MRRLSYFITALILSSLWMSGCSNNPPPAAPPTAAPPTGPAAPSAAIGQNLEDASPGTPLYQSQDQQAVQALTTNLAGYGQATIQTQVGVDYVVQSYGYQPGAPQQAPPWTHIGQPQPESVQIPTYQVAAGSGAIQLYSRYDGSASFSFAPYVNLGGLVLYSTDQVALFEGTSPNGAYAILKIAYRAQNPAIQYYEISQAPGSPYLGGNYGPRYHVVQRVMATTFAYQTQPTSYPPQGNPYNYGGWN